MTVVTGTNSAVNKIDRDEPQEDHSATPTHGNHRNHYAQFRLYLRRNVTYVLRSISTDSQLFSEELRQQALHTLSYALGETDLWSAVRELLQILSPKMELAGHREDWLPYLHRGLEESQQIGDVTIAAECELQIGLTYRLLSDFTMAGEHLTQSMTLAEACGEQRIQARALNELAWLEHIQEEFATATAHVQRALALLPEDDPEQATCYRVLGMIALGNRDWQAAEECHQEALKRYRQNNDIRRVAWSMQNLAYAHREQGRYEDVFTYYTEALALLEQIQDRHHWAIVKTNLGIAYYHVGNYEMALQHYEEAKAVVHILQDEYHYARLATNYGLVYMDLQEYTKAIESFRQSATIHRKLGNLGLAINAEDGLIMALLRQKEFAQAIAVAQEALTQLQEIADTPRYSYLASSLQDHLKEALTGVNQEETGK